MTSVVVVLVVVVVAAIVIGLEITLVRGYFHAMRQETPQVDHLDDLGAKVESFIGGARWPWMRASLPLARLDFYEYGVRVHGSLRRLDWAMPDWRVHYRDIARSEHVVARLAVGNGLRLRTAQHNAWVIFWTTSPIESLLTRFASVGVPVASDPQRISLWTGRDL